MACALQWLTKQPDYEHQACYGTLDFSGPAFLYSLDEWHHLAVTWTAANGTFRVFRDGLLINEVRLQEAASPGMTPRHPPSGRPAPCRLSRCALWRLARGDAAAVLCQRVTGAACIGCKAAPESALWCTVAPAWVHRCTAAAPAEHPIDWGTAASPVRTRCAATSSYRGTHARTPPPPSLRARAPMYLPLDLLNSAGRSYASPVWTQVRGRGLSAGPSPADMQPGRWQACKTCPAGRLAGPALQARTHRLHPPSCAPSWQPGASQFLHCQGWQQPPRPSLGSGRPG